MRKWLIEGANWLADDDDDEKEEEEEHTNLKNLIHTIDGKGRGDAIHFYNVSFRKAAAFKASFLARRFLARNGWEHALFVYRDRMFFGDLVFEESDCIEGSDEHFEGGLLVAWID